MASEFTQYIHNIVVSNIKNRYQTELEYAETDEEKNEIMKILQKYDKVAEKKIDIFDNKMLQIDLLTMKKLFYRLKETQKINRLKLYFEEKYNTNETINQKNAENIIELLNTNVLKSKDIIYDVDNAKITDIKFILYDEPTKMVKYLKTKQVSSRKKKDELCDKNNNDDISDEEKPKKIKINKSTNK